MTFSGGASPIAGTGGYDSAIWAPYPAESQSGGKTTLRGAPFGLVRSLRVLLKGLDLDA
jgi:hypothetical protein